MLRTVYKHNNNRGYVLIVVVLMMLVMAALAAGMNRRASMQARVTANQTRNSQIHLGQLAALEETAWILSRNPAWRTGPSGASYQFDGIDYNRKVLDASISGFEDVVIVIVTAPGGLKQLTTSFQLVPRKIISYLIADTENHRIRMVDTSTGLITTFAGTGTSGYSGDGGPATAASLNYPKGIFADQAGNVFIADSLNHCIRKVDPDGIITTVAGNGSSGYSGDLGLAEDASLNEPHSVAVDGLGNIYVADSKNHCIRMVDFDTKIIEKVAGTCESSGYSGDNGLATAALLDEPCGIYVDGSRNIFIADTNNSVIRKVDWTSKYITPVAGDKNASNLGDGGPATEAKLSKPTGIFVEPSGDLYVADSDHHRIRKVDGSSQTITTVAGDGVSGYGGDGGPAIDASIQNPKSVWVDENYNILIADTENHRIRKVSGPSQDIYTAAGNGSGDYSGDDGPAIDASLKKPHGVCLYESRVPAYLYISDPSNYQIRKVDLKESFLTKAAGTIWSGYNGDHILATWARLNYPFGVHLDASGNLYIADTYNHRIRKVNAKTRIITTVAGKGSKGFSGDGGPATSARLRYPFSLYVDSAGNIFIADTYNYRIRKVDGATGIITTVVGDGHHRFQGDGGPAISASIDKAYDLAVDKDGNLFIADSVNDVIRKVDAATGIIDTVAGQGKRAGYTGDGGPATEARLHTPTAVYVDSSGNIYISDSNNNVVRKVDGTTGIITTIVGTGDAGFSGDGGPASQAELDYPEGVWLDSTGNMFIVDTDNCRIRMVDSTTDIITTIAGTTFCGYNGNKRPATNAALYYPSDVSVYEPSSLERMSQIYRQSD
jgi:hypothetical protein